MLKKNNEKENLMKKGINIVANEIAVSYSIRKYIPTQTSIRSVNLNLRFLFSIHKRQVIMLAYKSKASIRSGGEVSLFV